ncbi:hypothetical protein CDAR_96421 [Caerostris darwini]|uniref:LAGLIDADG homing endonuclease n=1 Tax=Caerostris darwini TaxID=1538125 RepID=A0AAV4TB68_9ARAC|nr:hypothetical protein CDAR_96421 [Caerostris darwini]
MVTVHLAIPPHLTFHERALLGVSFDFCCRLFETLLIDKAVATKMKHRDPNKLQGSVTRRGSRNGTKIYWFWRKGRSETVNLKLQLTFDAEIFVLEGYSCELCLNIYCRKKRSTYTVQQQ